MAETKTKSALDHLGEGLEYYKKDQFEEADACFTKALELEPDNFKANYSKGLVLQDLGKPFEAIKFLTRATELGPTPASLVSQQQNNQEAKAPQNTHSEGTKKPRACCNMF